MVNHVKKGLVSVTFRSMQPMEILDLVSEAGLEAIEWGGDIHVPVGDLVRAAKIGQETRIRGIAIPTYGSYYYAGLKRDERDGDRPNPDFARVLATAEALGADNIRVWANHVASRSADEATWQRTADDLARIGDMAAASGIMVSLEYHNNTLNDRPAATSRLLSSLTKPHPIYTFWQPLNELDFLDNLETLQAAQPYLSHVHVFAGQGASCLLKTAEAEWFRYLPRLLAIPEIETPNHEKKPRCYMIEFVQNETRESFQADAATLADWLAKWGH